MPVGCLCSLAQRATCVLCNTWHNMPKCTTAAQRRPTPRAVTADLTFGGGGSGRRTPQLFRDSMERARHGSTAYTDARAQVGGCRPALPDCCNRSPASSTCVAFASIQLNQSCV